MERLIRSRLLAMAFTVVGVTMFVAAYVSTERLTAMNEGEATLVTGRVVDVTDDSVRLTYQLSQVDRTATAHPDDPGSFQAGDLVRLRVPPGAGTIVGIEGAPNDTSRHLPFLVTGASVTGGGLIWLLSLIIVDRGVPPLDPVKYAGHRHGGA